MITIPVGGRGLARRLLVPAAIFLLGLYGYAQLAAWTGAFHADNFFVQWIELSIVAYLYCYFCLIQKPHAGRYLFAAAPIVLAYLAQDLYFHFYGRVLRIIEVLELPELFGVLPWHYGIVLGLVFLFPLAAYLYKVDFRRYRRVMLGAVPPLALVLTVETAPRAWAQFVETTGNEIVRYSDSKSVESNGRLTMLLYREAQRIEALAATEPYRNPAEYDRQAEEFAAQLATQGNRRNVHLIVLESFLDPTLFQGARYSRDPAHPEFRKLFGDNLGLSIAPVFGGSTAQAEFEALCGVPAFEKLTSVEFNLFTGSPANCLPGIMQRLGYRTVATNAYKPNFFNAQPAYKGMGFDEIYFPEEFSGTNPTYFRTGDVGDEDFLFDGELFRQNLAFVADHLKKHPGQPLLNYVMTIYGHTPHLTDPKRRPSLIEVSGDHEDRHLTQVVNQYYYRTGAIARFVRELLDVDPDSQIILLADHVPPLVYGPITYRELGYLGNVENSYYHNRVMIVEHGKARRYATMRHYNIPQVVYNYLTDGSHCSREPCAHLGTRYAIDRTQYLPRYYQIMAHASR